MKQPEYVKQVALRLLSRPDFQADIALIRKEAGMPTEGFDSEVAAEDWRNKHLYWKENAYLPIRDGVSRLIRKYSMLNSRWKDSLMDYIYLNSLDEMRMPTEIEVGSERDPSTGRIRVYMKIPIDATQREIREILPVVTMIQDDFRIGGKSKRQPAYNSKLGAEATALYRELRPYSKVAEVMSERYGRSFDKLQVKDWIRRFKEQSGAD